MHQVTFLPWSINTFFSIFFVNNFFSITLLVLLLGQLKKKKNNKSRKTFNQPWPFIVSQVHSSFEFVGNTHTRVWTNEWKWDTGGNLQIVSFWINASLSKKKIVLVNLINEKKSKANNFTKVREITRENDGHYVWLVDHTSHQFVHVHVLFLLFFKAIFLMNEIPIFIVASVVSTTFILYNLLINQSIKWNLFWCWYS